MTDWRDVFTHPAMRTGVGTILAYGIILAVLTVVLFLVPFALFRLF